MSQTMTQGSTEQAAATYELRVTQEISGTPVQVSDEAGNTTPLYLGSSSVVVGQTSEPTGPNVLQVQGNFVAAPLFSIYNGNTQTEQQPEASINFQNASDHGSWWHAGVGGGAGAMTFFLWNSNLGVAALTVDKDGNLQVQGSIVAIGGIDANKTKLVNLPSVTTAPQGANLAAVVVDRAKGVMYAA